MRVMVKYTEITNTKDNETIKLLIKDKNFRKLLLPFSSFICIYNIHVIVIPTCVV